MKILFPLLAMMYLSSVFYDERASSFSINFSTDTIPKQKVILYHEDSTLHKLLHQKFLHKRDSATIEASQILFLQNLSNIMGLSFLNEDTAELTVRIWVWDVEYKSKKVNYVINISNILQGRDISIFEFGNKIVDSSEYIVVYNKWQNIIPKSGWDSFFSTIDSYHILSMKSGKSYEKQTDFLTTMAYVQFEIAQAGQYRFYEYLEPSYYRYIENGSMNVYKFLKYFINETGVSIYRPAEKAFVKPK